MHKLLSQAIDLDDVSLLMTINEDSELEEALYYACKTGKLKIAKYLIEDKKINPHLMIDSLMAMDNGSVFKFAAESGNLELVKYLFERWHVDIEARGEHAGTQDTALSRAARKGHLDVVKYLLAKGADAKSKISPYSTILSEGISSGSIDVVNALVTAGAKIEDKDLHYAIEKGHLDIVKYLIQQGADIHERYIAPYTQVAAKSGNVELLKFVEEQGLHILDPDKYSSWKDPQYEMLAAAAESGNSEMMRYLVDICKLDLIGCVTKDNTKKYAYEYDSYSTILGNAIRGPFLSNLKGSNLPLIQYLFDELHLIPPREALKRLKAEKAKFSGIQVNAYLQSYLTNSETDRKLLLTIADKGLESVDIPTLFRLYNTGLIPEGDYNHFESQIHERIESLNLTNEQLSKLNMESNDFFHDALFYYSEYHFNDNFEKLKYLVDQGANVNQVNDKGENVVLHAVSSGGYNNIAKFLIANGADVDQPCHEGRTVVNALSRQLGTSDNALEEMLKNAKDYTNSLKQACKASFDISLAKILAHSKGAIGNATAKELLESSIESGKIQTLLTYVSKPIFEEMKALLLDKQFMEQHELSPSKVNEILIRVKKNETPESDVIYKTLGSAFNQLTTMTGHIMEEIKNIAIKTTSPSEEETKRKHPISDSQDVSNQSSPSIRKAPKLSQTGMFASTDINDVMRWTGKSFGKLRDYKILDNDIRILLHSGGFAIFFPKDVWHQFDLQVNNCLSHPTDTNGSCWIAGKDFAFLKIDTDRNELAEEDKDYASDDAKVALNKIEQFVKKNFIDNPRAFPDSDYFTIGSFVQNPDMPRPFRMRMGGNFNLQS